MTKQHKTWKLQAIDSSHYRGKFHYGNDGTQNYLVFQTDFRY